MGKTASFSVAASGTGLLMLSFLPDHYGATCGLQGMPGSCGV